MISFTKVVMFPMLSRIPVRKATRSLKPTSISLGTFSSKTVRMVWNIAVNASPNFGDFSTIKLTTESTAGPSFSKMTGICSKKLAMKAPNALAPAAAISGRNSKKALTAPIPVSCNFLAASIIT